MIQNPVNPIKNRMTAIEKAVNEIIALAKERKDNFPEAINWGDLKCADVEYVESLYNKSFYRASIEEASPDCPKFIQFIRSGMRSRGFGEVEIVTEW